MTQQRRAFELFKQASEVPADQLGRFLDRECSQDGELRKKVEHLLSARNDARDFLPDEVSPSPVDDADVPTIDTRDSRDKIQGKTIGPFKLLQEIGEGGFGVVYMAEQLEPVRRQVALKIIKPGMDSREVIARFEVERQALAMMDHPNIARVFDAGQTDDGRPYFVMELVKGGST